MSSIIISNIGQLITNSDQNLGIINDAALVIENGKVQWVGENKLAPATDNLIDADGGVVTPGFVDSHTHAVLLVIEVKITLQEWQELNMQLVALKPP